MTQVRQCKRLGIIMAGGAGERFWPLSRKDKPKQLLHLASKTETMLEEAISRLAPLIAKEDIYVITGLHLAKVIRDSRPGIPPENILAEPCRRDTGGCLVYAAACMLAKYGGDGSKLSMAVVTADHVIPDVERFRETVDAALSAAETHGVLATHGIVPSRPETGYGYIQMDDTAPPLSNGAGIPVHRVRAFHEKPSEEKAKEFIEDGRYFWNGGMFFWRIDSFLRELNDVRPEMTEALHAIRAALEANDDNEARRIFESVESISIDYALMEHAKAVAVARADYAWDDIGAWPAFARTRESDSAGNVTQGDPILIDCRDSIVYTDASAGEIAVGVVGVEGLVVVVTKDAVLVMPKGSAQDIRRVVQELKDRGANQV